MITMAVTLTKDNFTQSIESGVTLVDFWAPWCGPCKMQLPIVEELSSELQGKATVGKINVDEEPELASQFGVMSIPTLILFKDGQPVDKMVGLQSKDALKNKIQGQQ
jgi:thioredoxin 1